VTSGTVMADTKLPLTHWFPDFSADVARLLAELKHPRVAGDARRATASIISNRIAIAKGQQHGNREAKKPQKQKPKIHDLRWDLQFAHQVAGRGGGGLTSSPRSGSPQRANTASRTLSRNFSTDAKSTPDGATGGAISTLIDVRRGNHCSLRSIDRVPRMTPGKTGRRASAATLKAPR
jgi:hypothetical protein